MFSEKSIDIIDEEYITINYMLDDVYGSKYYEGVEYPVIPDINKWETFLERKIKDKESLIIMDYLDEINNNNKIIKLLTNVNNMNCGFYTIPVLTKNNGNCMFESLSFFKIDDIKNIRKKIGAILILEQFNENFFPDRKITLNDMFENCNDIGLIKINKYERAKYNYDNLLSDIFSYSWTRLPTEMILLIISKFYKLNIHIFSNLSSYEHIITCWNDKNCDMSTIMDVYIGHIDERHYIPLIRIDNTVKLEDKTKYYEYICNIPIYATSHNKYHLWAKERINKKKRGPKPKYMGTYWEHNEIEDPDMWSNKYF